jgi:hypothetical protein
LETWDHKGLHDGNLAVKLGQRDVDVPVTSRQTGLEVEQVMRSSHSWNLEDRAPVPWAGSKGPG